MKKMLLSLLVGVALGATLVQPVGAASNSLRQKVQALQADVASLQDTTRFLNGKTIVTNNRHAEMVTSLCAALQADMTEATPNLDEFCATH